MKIELSKKYILLIIVIITALISSIPSLYFFNKYQQAQKILQDPTELIKLENEALVVKVGKIIDLPEGENPEIRTVIKKEDVNSQPFFAKAENGDRILVYSQVKKAFLYRPSLNKIINVAPVNLALASPTPVPVIAGAQTTPITLLSPTSLISPTSPPQPATQNSLTTQPLRFYLHNRTPKIGLTQKYEPILKKSLPQATVVDRDSAKKSDYTKSFIIDINGDKYNETEQLAKLLGLTVGKLPDDEEKPQNTDFLIILGSDKQNL